MQLKPNEISIFKISGKKYRVKLYEPDSNNLQVITHYLHNRNESEGSTYKDDAYLYMRDLLKRESDMKKIRVSDVESAFQYMLFEMKELPFPPPVNPKFTFIDLFAGIGGFRIAMQNLGGKCVYSSEWDLQAQQTYMENFGEIPFGDITKEHTKKYIPDNFDVLCAGFTCQAFSIAWKR